MLRTAIVGFTALLIAAPTLAYAQAAAPQNQNAQEAPNTPDWKAFTDARIDVLKSALQLTPDQQKYWPAVEEAIRARAEARRARIEALAKMGQEQPDLFDILRQRADSMTQRGAALKQLADAWEPLYKTLDDKQKMRLRVVAMLVMHEAKGAMERHMNGMQDQGEGNDEGDGGGEE